MRFTKVHGLGNDFVVMGADEVGGADRAALARSVCDRRTGVGADGLLLIEPASGTGAVARMPIYNSDGSTAEMCGNGIRCVARLLVQRGAVRGEGAFTIETGAGPRGCQVVERAAQGDWLVRVSMGRARFGPEATGVVPRAGFPPGGPWAIAGERAWLVDVWISHAVSFVERALSAEDLARRGRAVEHDPRFPARLNAQFTIVESRRRVRVQTWERGAGATAACGTGACAVLAAGVRAGLLDRAADVVLPGGALRVEWPADDAEILKTGPATMVFEGDWPG